MFESVFIFISCKSVLEMSFQIVKACGSAYDVGVQIGKHFSELSHKIPDSIYKSKVVRKSLPKLTPVAILREYAKMLARKIRKKVRNHYPYIDEIIEGIAEGAGVKPILIYELNAFETISGGLRVKDLFAPFIQCTGVVTPRFVAKNYDFPDELENYQYIRIWRINGHNATFSLTHHFIPGTHAGINDKGIALVYTYVESSDAIVDNIPTSIILEALLQEVKSLDEAIEFIKEAPRATGANILISDGKRAVIIEESPTKINIREGEVLVASNHYVSEEMQDVNLPEDKTYPARDFRVRIIVSSRMRYDRMLQLVEDGVTLEKLMEAFKDHYPEPGENSICRHGPYWHTLSSIIFDLKEKVLYATKGNPCSNPYRKYEITFC